MNTVPYNKGKNISPIAFIFACPGQKEEKVGRVVAGATGKNLDLLLSILSSSEKEEIRSLFPSSSRYDYLITNSSDIIHYPALDSRSLPSKKEYSEKENVKRLCEELSEIKHVIAFGKEAKEVSLLVKAEFLSQNLPSPTFILSIPHLSFLSLNQIREDKEGKKIEKGDKEGTKKRLEVIAEKIEKEIGKNFL